MEYSTRTIALRTLGHRDFGIAMLERMNDSLPVLVNLKCAYGECGEQLLAEYEMDALIDVLLSCLATLGWGSVSGSLAIYAQVDGEEPVLNLSAGVRTALYSSDSVPVGEVGKRTLATAQEFLKKELICAKHVKCLPCYHMKGLPIAVVLQTDVGRFSIAFDGIHDRNNMTDHFAVFGAITQTLACMRADDTVLQEACAELEEEMRRVKSRRGLGAMEVVRELFADTTHPIVKDWRKGPPLSP